MNGLLALTIEAMLDAVRRRLALAVGVVCLLSIMMLDNCTGALPTTMMMNGEEVDIGDTVAGTTGVITFVVLSLWMVVLAGVLAADQLRETLEDGSATLALARPVSRLTFALARLGGVLAVAWGATALLLGSATFLLATRHEVPAPPGILGTLACALGGFVVAAWSMTASLYLPRTATTLMVFAAVGLIAISNLVGLGTEAGGYLGLLDRFGTASRLDRHRGDAIVAARTARRADADREHRDLGTTDALGGRRHHRTRRRGPAHRDRSLVELGGEGGQRFPDPPCVLHQFGSVAALAPVETGRVAVPARNQMHVVVEDGLTGGRAVQLMHGDAVRREGRTERPGGSPACAGRCGPT